MNFSARPLRQALVTVVSLLPLASAQSEPLTFRDCASNDCPQMILIPASPPGTQVGSPEGEEGRLTSEQQHAVTIPAFALGKYEVSVGEYMACVSAGGCRHPEWLDPGGTHNIETGSGVTYKSMSDYIKGEGQPVVGISWDDAAAYGAWLSAKTKKTYRLPSESEWEYGARAGSRARFSWGDEVRPGGSVMACCRECGSERDGKGLYPAMSFAPNPLGLHNMHGNVWEWVADYYCEDYSSVPADGSPQTSKHCNAANEFAGLRVFRGGSCFYEARQMRASMRLRNTHDFRNQTVGFRIARSVDANETSSMTGKASGESK